MEDKPAIDEKVNEYVKERIQKLKKKRAIFIIEMAILVVLLFVTPYIGYIARHISNIIGYISGAHTDGLIDSVADWLKTDRYICNYVYPILMTLIIATIAIISIKKIRKINFKIRNAKNEMDNVLAAPSTPDDEPTKPLTPYKPF